LLRAGADVPLTAAEGIITGVTTLLRFVEAVDVSCFICREQPIISGSRNDSFFLGLSMATTVDVIESLVSALQLLPPPLPPLQPTAFPFNITRGWNPHVAFNSPNIVTSITTTTTSRILLLLLTLSSLGANWLHAAISRQKNTTTTIFSFLICFIG
jgi:hypothetical protein